MEQILTATIHDVELLVTLVNHAYRGKEAKAGWTNESDLISGQRINTEQMTLIFSDPLSTILKFVLHNEIVGCVLLKKEDDALYLGMLSVNPTLQNAGIGKKLMAASEVFALNVGCTNIKMTVFSVRTELIDWYNRRGYIDTGERIPFTNENFGKAENQLVFSVLSKKLSIKN